MNDRILVVFGTLTGNAEICADNTVKRLKAEGFAAETKDIFDLQPENLLTERLVLLCISTYGEGDPPDSAVDMWEKVTQKGSYDLSQMSFSILALGDSSYTKFCQCGKDFDAAFERHGATRLAPRVDCDGDYEKPWAKWIETVVSAVKVYRAQAVNATPVNA